MAVGTYRSIFQVGDNAIATFSVTYDPEQYIGIPPFDTVEFGGSGAIYEDLSNALLISSDFTTRSSYLECAMNSLGDIHIGDEITQLNHNMIYGFNVSHVDLYLGSGITDLPYFCFGIPRMANHYIYFDHVYFPSGCNVMTVGQGAFQNQNFLQTIDLNDSIQYYARDCFNECSLLTHFADGNNRIDGKIYTDAFVNCKALQHFTFTENTVFVQEENPTVLPFRLPQDTGVDCDEDGNLYTYIHGYIGVAQTLDWITDAHRNAQYDQPGQEIYRLMHNNTMHIIKGYDSGHLPQRHKGNLYWLRFVEDGDPKQSPLVIKHKGVLHYISI